MEQSKEKISFNGLYIIKHKEDMIFQTTDSSFYTSDITKAIKFRRKKDAEKYFQKFKVNDNTLYSFYIYLIQDRVIFKAAK